MLVTKKKYYMDEALVSKLDLMVKRMKGTDDNILLIDGDEGQGKTEKAMGICYYVAEKTKRKYNINNIFFDLDKMIQFAVSTKEKIIHYDEGALGLLTVQWFKKNQQKFLQLVMIARKKKHFIVICIPKFYKLNQYIVQERSIGLIHVYSRNNLKKGYFTYYTKSAKDKLYIEWNKRKVKTYQKNFSFSGRFIIASIRIFTQEQNDAYDKKKDDAIMSLTDIETNQLTKLQKRQLEQRDGLIKYMYLNEGLSIRSLVKKLDENGIDIPRGIIQEVCHQTSRPL